MGRRLGQVDGDNLVGAADTEAQQDAAGDEHSQVDGARVQARAGQEADGGEEHGGLVVAGGWASGGSGCARGLGGRRGKPLTHTHREHTLRPKRLVIQAAGTLMTMPAR